MGILDSLFGFLQKETVPENLGLIGKSYTKHEKRPSVVICNGILVRDNGDGTYRSEDGSRKYTYEQLFGELPIAKK